MEKISVFAKVIFLLLMDSFLTSGQAFLMKCSYYQLHFQKIIGFRPSDTFLTSSNLLWINETTTELVNRECWKMCQNDDECMGYVYLMEEQKCYAFTNLDRSIKYQPIPQNIELVPDTNAIYFEKICLSVPETCKIKLWPIVKIPGSSLIFQGKKTISSLITKRDCAERCLFEKEFKCLSASFTPSYKNNQARFSDIIPRSEIVGSCILNDKDKNTSPDAYKSGLLDEEYIENHCHEKPIESITCSYELFSNSTFLMPELKYYGLTQKQCQENCTNEKQFYCQGASYIYEPDHKPSQCFLHSEDLISVGPRGLQLKKNSIYLRRVKCLNVSVQCNNEEMIIKFSTSDWFRGKLYVSSHSEDCSVDGNGTSTTLSLPIGNEQKESKCGILRAYEVNPSFKRTFISTLVVVQSNPNVQTQGDRIIKVGCIITSPYNELPNALALESSNASNTTFNTTQTADHKIQEPFLLNSADRKNGISMQIIDLNKQFETNDVQIGQNLEFRIIESPKNKYYDIKVTSLLANSNGQIFQLIDKNGCPTDPAVFPKLEKVVTEYSKILRAKFNAFKFAGTSLVSFDAILQFCLMECPSSNCDRNNFFGKRRKRNENDFTTLNEAIQVKNSLYVTSVGEIKKLEGNGTEMAKLEVPLSLNINVHESIWDGKDGLVYGDNGLIITGDIENSYYSRNDVVCMNQSLLVAVIIFAIICIIILLFSCCFVIMKYKKLAELNDDKNSMRAIHEHLQYIDGNRRVHWGDNSAFAF